MYNHSETKTVTLLPPDEGVQDFDFESKPKEFAKSFARAEHLDHLRAAGKLKPDSPWKGWGSEGRKLYMHVKARVVTLRLPDEGIQEFTIHKLPLEFLKLFAQGERLDKLPNDFSHPRPSVGRTYCV